MVQRESKLVALGLTIYASEHRKNTNAAVRRPARRVGIETLLTQGGAAAPLPTLG